MHLVDFANPGYVPGYDFGITIDLLAYIETHKTALRFKWGAFSGGNVGISDRKNLQENLQYALDTIQFLQNIIANETPLDIAALNLGRVADPSNPEFGNELFSFSTIVAARVEKCFKQLVKKYGCSRGAVDIFGRGHCRTALLYVVVDV